MDAKEEYRKWGESAYYWDHYRNTIEQIYGPITEAILGKSGIASNHRVLDIGGGAGEPSLTIRGKTGTEIFFTDPATGMASFARKEAIRRSLDRIYFCVCSGDELPFADQVFDRIVSRLSIMFIPDTSRAIREIMRVTRTGGKITFAVWNDSKKNPMHSVPIGALSRFIPATPQPPDAPGPFRFAQPGLLATHLEQAGAQTVEEVPIDFEISGIRSIDDFWDIRSQMSESLRDKLAQLSPDQRKQAVVAVKESVRDYYKDGSMRLPASIRLITATVGR